MTYKLKDYLIEDKVYLLEDKDKENQQYVGTEVNNGEIGFLAFAVPETNVPIRPGNMGTHNALFNTNLTNKGKKPSNVHVEINYLPFITFNNKKELEKLRTAINSFNEKSVSEDNVLKGLESLLSKQKSRKGVKPKEKQNKDKDKEKKDITDYSLPVTHIEAKKASKKLAKLFNRLSKKNTTKIKDVLSKYQEASIDDKEKYQENIYDLGLTKKNLNNLSDINIPFSSNKEAKGKEVR